MDNNFKNGGFVNAKEEQVYKQDMGMKKIVKVDLYIRWEDGLEEEISTRLPDGINSDLEDFFDALEQERHEDEFSEEDKNA